MNEENPKEDKCVSLETSGLMEEIRKHANKLKSQALESDTENIEGQIDYVIDGILGVVAKAEAERKQTLTEAIKFFHEVLNERFSVIDGETYTRLHEVKQKFEALVCEGAGKGQPPKTESE